MKPYRVLVVTNLWPTESDPGYGSFVQAQMESLRPLGVEFDTLFIDGRASRRNYLRAFPELLRRTKERQFDIVHAHFGLSGLVARGQFGLPLVVTFHGDDVLGQPTRSGRITLMGRFFQVSSFLLAPLASAVIVQNREMKRRLKLASARIIPCGVDLALFRPVDRNEARKSLGLNPEKKYVLFPYYRAERRKRFDLIEAAVAIARKQLPQIEILEVCGKPHRDLPLYMNASDVLVLASMIEGSPMAVKEAMAVNLPVVAVEVGDVPELIGTTEGCYIVPREAGPLSEKILEVCRRSIRTNGREHIARWSLENVARDVVAVYAGITDSRP
ncbi:MAG TPA: glycosyltransferase [Terriglobia bacterium]|nr:glycosyltransferase [Terriglobia bacterium]